MQTKITTPAFTLGLIPNNLLITFNISSYLLFLKILKTRPPIIAPYTDEFTGLDVIAQLPEIQPICCQYKNPHRVPIVMPTSTSIFFLRKYIIIL
jgi:hypothetical protein